MIVHVVKGVRLLVLLANAVIHIILAQINRLINQAVEL